MEQEQDQAPTPEKKSLVSSLFLPQMSFREDNYQAHKLRPSEKKSLQELKSLLSSSPPTPPPSLWGVPLLPGDDRADVILLKFLRARDFNPSQAHEMLLRCFEWRRDFSADQILNEDLGFKDLEGVVAYLHGKDKEGHPVCYNAYGVFKDKDLYERVFGDEERLNRFLRWRVQIMEKGLSLLQFKPGGVNSIIQVTDLKDMPKRELRTASNQILSLFQDNYPELVARKVFINVPWYFSVLYSVFSPFLTQRTKSKFVLAKEADVAETLYRFIRPEFIPVQYGGLSRAGEMLDPPPKPASDFSVKSSEKVNLEIDGIEAGATITWELIVGGWEVEYCAEFAPSAAGSYSIAVARTKKFVAGDEPIHQSFAAKEAGKLILSVDNTASRRRKVAAYRYSVRKHSAATE